ncbi:MAG: hypothetical protein ACREER_07940 [Alphaproteobacteria bacterium]
MRHAGTAALEALEPLFAELRRLPGLTERRPGVFYRGGQAFLHCHDDPAGLFVDLKQDGAFVRYPATAPKDRRTIVTAAAAALAALAKAKEARRR